MTQARDIFTLGNPKTVDELVRSLSSILPRISDRLDRMESLRGRATFYDSQLQFPADTPDGLIKTTAGLTGQQSTTSPGTALLTAQSVAAQLALLGIQSLGLQSSSAASITGGSISGVNLSSLLFYVPDENQTVIHAFSIEMMSGFSDTMGFY